MALSLLASVCVFTANAEDPGFTVNSAAELLEALETENAQITLGSDIVFNEGYTFAYDEDNAVITVSDANGTVAKISTGEAEGSTPGAVIEGSLDGLTKWTPLENLNGADIDGAGHTIKGLYVNGRAFAKTIAVGESVKDLKFENTLVLSSGEYRTATLAGLLYGDVYNVDFKNSYVVAANVPQYWIVGGAIADQYSSVSGTTETYNPTVDDVTFDGAVFANSVAADKEITVGGVIGHNKGGTVTNCENYGTVKIATGKPYAAGGVIGLIEPTAASVEAAKTGAPKNVYVYNAANYGKISSAQYAGGVIGYIDPYSVSGGDIVIHNVYNDGKVATGAELIGRCNTKHGEAPIGDASFTYGFITHDTTNELVMLSTTFEKLSIAKEAEDKVLAYLNHGATAVEGLKTWTNDNGVMKMTDTKATYDSAFEAKDITTDTSFDKLIIESVKVLNEKELEITFSEAVTINYQVTAFIRYTSAPGTLAWKDTDGDGDNDPLQFAAGLRHNGTNKMIATLSSSVTTSLADILAMKGFESDNYSVAFCIEGLEVVPGTRIVGEIEEIKAVYSDKNLVATKPHANGTYDGYYIEITDTDKATVAFTEATALPEVADAVIDVNPTPAVSLKPATDDGVYIKSVTVINETQLEVVFSEAVTAKAGVFAGIRYTDNKLNLRTDASLADPNLQFYGNLALDGTDKGVFTYDPSANGGKTLYDVLSRKGYEKSLYSVYFCIEGLPNLGEEYEYQAGYIDNITSADGSKMLSAVIADENDKAYEKYYIAITGGENAKPEGGEGGEQPAQPNYEVPADSVKIESVKVINQNTMEITFSEAVKVVRWPFVGIRYTDINHNLRTDSSLDDPNLQFYGSLAFDGNKATFTYDPEHSLNRGLSFYEVLTMKGYEDKGYYLAFCLEGLPSDIITDPKAGYVDNIASEADNTKLLGANKASAGGIYDGCYAPIENIENAKPGDVVPTVEVDTYEKLAAALAEKSNTVIKVTADITANAGVSYTYDAESGKIVIKNGETPVAEYGTGAKETVAGALISGSIDGLAKWTGLTVKNGNTVDFQGHKVSGFILEYSLFTEIDKTAAVKNVNVENVFILATAASVRAGAVAATNRGVIDTASVKDAIMLVTGKSANAGMAIGYMNSDKEAGKENFNPTANNIRTDGTLLCYFTEGGPCIGGIIGKIQGGKLINSVNSADIIHNGTKRYGTGGLVGLAEFDAGQITEENKAEKSVTNIYIINNANYGKLEMAAGLNGGGVIGFADLIWSVSSSFTAQNLYNSGKVTVGAGNFGQRQGISSLGGGTISCGYILDNAANSNAYTELSGKWAGEANKQCQQAEALTLLNANAVSYQAIGGDENAKAWGWKTEGGILVPDKDTVPSVTPPPADGPDFTTSEGGVKLESVKVIDEVTLELKFSEPIKTVGYSFRGIRYVNKDLGLQRDESLTDPHLQWYGATSFTIDANDSSKATWVYNPDDATNRGNTLYEVLTFKGYEDKGYFLTFCFEGVANANIPNPVVGYVDNIQSADGTKLLAANKASAGGIYDGCYAPIDDIQNALLPQGGGNTPGGDTPSEIEVSTYQELAAALASKSNCTIKVTADLVVNEGVTYTYDAESGKVLVKNGEATIAEYGTGKNETVAGELISGSIDGLARWTALTINNGNTVDFQGHKVSGYVLANSLFTNVDKSATLKNINVENVFLYANNAPSIRAGILVSTNNGVVDTASIKDSVVLVANSKSANAGMAIGYMQSAKKAGEETFNPTANNIRTDGTLIYSHTDGGAPCIGGIIGKVNGGKLTNSVNGADVIQTGTVSYGTGGLVGLVEFDAGVINADTDKSTKTVTNIYIMNCANYGTIDVMPGMYGAGLLGYCDLIWSVSSTLTVNNVYNGGKLINCASPFITRSQGYTSLGGGTVSCDYFFTNSELDNPFALPTGRFVCDVIMKCEQEYALECLNGNVGRLTDIGGLEGLNAWAWVEDGDIIVPDAEAEIPEIAPKPDLPPVDPAEPNFTTTEGGVKIESVTAIDYQTLEIVFSEEIERVSSFFIALRYVDANLNLMRDPTLKDPNLQFYGKSTTISGNKLTWVYDPEQNDEKTLYDILTYKGYENLGYRVTFCIEGLPDTTNIPEPVVGYVDNIRSKADPTKLLAANKASAGGIYDSCFAPITGTENAIPPEAGENPDEPTVDMTPTENGITILSVKAINETQLEITFSEPVKAISNVFAAVRYTNSSLKLAQDVSLEDPNLQFYGGLKFDGTDKAIFTFKPTDNRCLYDILTRRGYESKNYFVYFCIEGLPTDKVPEPKVGYIDNVTSLDGTKLLAANKPTSAAGVYDGYYVEIEDGNKSKPADYTKKPFYDVEVLSAKVLNEKEIEVTFSEPVRLVGDVFTAIRYVNPDNNNLIWDDGVPLHFITGERFNNSRKAILTLSSSETLTMAEILAKSGYEDTNYAVKLCFEGLATSSIKKPLQGYIDNVQTYDGRGLLLANKPTSSEGIYDGLYIDLEDVENATLPFEEATPLPEPEVPVIPLDPEVLTVPEDSIKILSCQVINSTQIKIVFSQAIETQGAMFKAVRYVDRNLNLQWVNGQPLQFWEFELSKTEGNTMIYTWNRTDKSLKDVITMKGYENAGYYLTWCFEGLPGNGIKNPKPGYVDNIKAKGGTKLLGANKYNAGGVYDGCYAQITGLENISKPGPRPGYVEVKNRPHLTLKSCKVINPSQIELIFSEPIKSAGGMFTAIRYTDKNYSVQRDESLKDPYLQFTGGLAIDGTERAVWTLSGSSEKTLYELLNKKGYEKSGYYVYFCIEGLPTASTKEPGYIDNIVSVDGKKLLKCTPEKASAGGVYDGLYAKIENVEMAVPIEVPDLEGIFVDQIELITPYKLEFVFSEPVYIVGLGTEATQYQALKASVRYVDPKTYETITYNDRIMQFAADFYIEDGDTIGLFEIRDQETTIKDLFDMVDYEDLKDIAMPVLCLEGTPDMDLIPTPYPGYVDNVQNEDGTNMLTAMIAHGGGIYDAWIATADEINLEVRKTEMELLKELVATDKMSKTELEAFAAMDEATLKEKLTKAKGLLEALKSGEMTDAGVAAFNALLAKNGIDNAEKVKAMMFTVGETYDVGLPMLINLDVRDREYDWSDTVYVYRVNADGSVTEIAQKGMIVYVADEIITRIEFADTVLGDYFVTNSHLELPKPFNPAIIAYIAIGVMVLALVALVIFLASKKKKEKKA